MGSESRIVRRVEAGDGQPAVVLEAGLNNGAASWGRVMPLLALPTTVRESAAARPHRTW
jgi:hypothetical protein